MRAHHRLVVHHDHPHHGHAAGSAVAYVRGQRGLDAESAVRLGSGPQRAVHELDALPQVGQAQAGARAGQSATLAGSAACCGSRPVSAPRRTPPAPSPARRGRACARWSAPPARCGTRCARPPARRAPGCPPRPARPGCPPRWTPRPARRNPRPRATRLRPARCAGCRPDPAARPAPGSRPRAVPPPPAGSARRARSSAARRPAAPSGSPGASRRRASRRPAGPAPRRGPARPADAVPVRPARPAR